MAALRVLYHFLIWTGTVAAGVAVVIFAISNRQPATLDFWPFEIAFDVPVFLLALAGMVTGAALAALAGGASLLRLRIRLAHASRDLAAARRQLAHARARGAELDARLHQVPGGLLQETRAADTRGPEAERFGEGQAGTGTDGALPRIAARRP